MQNRKRDTDVQNRLLDSVREGAGGMFQENSIETCILSMAKQITSPGWMHETNARGWCIGKTQRDWWRGRWEGGWGWGIHVNPWLILLCLMSESPSRKRESLQDNATSKKGKFITDSSQGPLLHPTQWCRSESPEPKLLHKFIG